MSILTIKNMKYRLTNLYFTLWLRQNIKKIIIVLHVTIAIIVTFKNYLN